MTTTAQINRSLHIKTSEKFYVNFLQLPDNLSNILGREVQMVSRPNIAFNESETYNKGKKWIEDARIEYQPIDISFNDDMGSLITYGLYEQVRRQASEEDYLFELSIEMYSTDRVIVETLLLKHCRIQNITHTEQIYTDSSNNLITVTIAFNELNYSFPILDE